TGFSGESGMLIVDSRGATVITDGRFTVQAKQEAPLASVVPQKDGLYRSCAALVDRRRYGKVGFESEHMTVAQLSALSKAAGKSVRNQPVPGLVQRLRAEKDAAELQRMRRAAAVADHVVEEAIKLLKPGIRELEVAAEIEHQMRLQGASGPAFETIVAF